MRRNKKIIIFSALIIAVFAVITQNAYAEKPYSGTTTVTINFPPPEISVVGDFHRIKMGDLPTLGNPGEPCLPVKNIKLLVPFGREIVDVEVISGEKIVLEGEYNIEPGQQEVPLSSRGWVKFTPKNKTIYESNVPFPGKLLEGKKIQRMRGYRIKIVNLHPVEYIPQTGELSYYKSLTVKMKTKRILPVTAAARRRISRGKLYRNLWRDKIKVMNFVANSTDIDAAEAQPTIDNLQNLSGQIIEVFGRLAGISEPNDAGAPLDDGSGSGDQARDSGEESPPLDGGSLLNPADSYEYVIITSEAFNNYYGPYSFHDLIASKQAKGISATIVTTEWIYSNYSGTRPDGGTDNQTRIRNFIIDAYQNWETEFILLGGDGDGADVGGESGDDIVPCRVLFDSSDTIPSDLYYICLDGSFDEDADGTYGELGDGVDGGDIDLLAELYIGRACVDSTSEIYNFVRKTLSYEASTDNYLKKAYMLGEHLGFGGDSEYAKNSMEEIRLGSSNYGYTTLGFVSCDFLNTYTLYDADGVWSRDQLISIINNGVHILNHLGHANVTYVMKMSNYYVDNSLTNDKYFFGYSQGCYSGSFDNRTTSQSQYTTSDCISEHFTTTPNGAFAFIGNSRYGWGVYNSTNGSSQRFQRHFWDVVFREGKLRLGQANQDSKEDDLGYIYYSRNRWVYFETNLFGDPEVSLKLSLDGSEGSVTFDKEVYSSTDTPTMTVSDADLNTNPITQETVQVSVTSTTEQDPETITLTETTSSSHLFTGSIQLAEGSPQNDGVLQVAASDIITVVYYDENTGTGVPANVSDTATVDGDPPVISNIESLSFPIRCIITWQTNEPSESKIYYGTTPSLGLTLSDSQLTTSHSIEIPNLNPLTTYYFDVESTDAVGNTTRDNNGGSHYQFTTPQRSPILLVDDDEGNTYESYFTNSLDQARYIYDVWDVNVLGSSPILDDLSPYPIVIWNVGIDSEADIDSSEEETITSYLDLGGKLIISGQFLLYKSLSSDFKQNYLHILNYATDSTVQQLLGIDGDPITAGMNLDLTSSQSTCSIVPDSSAAGIFISPDNSTYPYFSLRYPQNGNSTFKIVFFSVPIEVIGNSDTDPSNCKTITKKSILWLMGREITIIQPQYGLNDRLTSILITGKGFTEDVMVQVGSTECTTVFQSGTSILATVPSGLQPGDYNILVKYPDTINITSSLYFSALDPQDDEDGDGLTNYEEFEYGTDVLDSDTDNDGFSDFLEVENDWDPLDPNSPCITRKWHDWFTFNGEVPMVGDFNGDGKDDIVTFLQGNLGGFASGEVYVALSDGTKFGSGTRWHEFFSLSGEQALVGDFNGDGKDDIATVLLNSTGQVYVALSDGTRFGEPSWSNVWYENFARSGTVCAGDVNGDGKDDLVLFTLGEYHQANAGKVYVALSTGGSFAEKQLWHNWFCFRGEVPEVADFDGDGREDIVTFLQGNLGGFQSGEVYVALSEGSQFEPVARRWHEFFSLTGEQAVVGDFNGDCKDDVATVLSNSTGQVYVALSDATRFGQPEWSTVWHDDFCYSGKVLAGDVNGDGKDDLMLFTLGIYFQLDAGKVYVALSTGQNFGPWEP